MPPFSIRLESDSVDVIWDERGVCTRCVAESLVHHPAQHRTQPVRVFVVVLPHLLECGVDPHLAGSNADGGVDEVEVGELAVDAVVDYVQ